MKFEVNLIEFEITKGMEKIRYNFFECLKKYAPKAISEIKSDCENNKVIFKLERKISLNTINKALALLQDSTNIDIEEIEYKPKDAKVEVEVE